MTELERVIEKLIRKHKVIYGPMEEHELEELLKDAFKPEHMKLTREVKGLIEAINEYFDAEGSIGSEKIDEALKPFEKE